VASIRNVTVGQSSDDEGTLRFVPARPRVLEFDVSIDRERRAISGRGGIPLQAEDAWSAEHLVLAALVKCTLTSLDFSLRRAGIAGEGAGSAHGVVTKRAEDGRYAFVEIEASYDVALADPPAEDAIQGLIERTERGCFVGNSLAIRPRYRWTVNGEVVR
jgi:uncharacterized OsmC-like protein